MIPHLEKEMQKGKDAGMNLLKVFPTPIKRKELPEN